VSAAVRGDAFWAVTLAATALVSVGCIIPVLVSRRRRREVTAPGLSAA
jgi:hypothetical protein